MDPAIIPILFGLLLSFASYLSDSICLGCSKHKYAAISAIAGVSIAYVFLQLLPELTFGSLFLSRAIFIFVLLGFVVFHISEKYTLRHTWGYELKTRLEKEHEAAVFTEHFLFGIALVGFFSLGFVQGFLLFIPIALFNLILNIPMYHAYRKGEFHTHHMPTFSLPRFLHVLAPILGVLFGTIIELSIEINFGIIAFVSGMVLYIVIREFIPHGRKGSPFFFLLGAILYSLLIGLSWLFV